MVETSTMGMRRGWESIVPSAVTNGLLDWTRQMSALVPPMSMVIKSLRPDKEPACRAPITPAAGPDRRTDTGRSATSRAEVIPPRDCMIWTGA